MKWWQVEQLARKEAQAMEYDVQVTVTIRAVDEVAAFDLATSGQFVTTDGQKVAVFSVDALEVVENETGA